VAEPCIAEIVGRDPGTISRELRRYRGLKGYRPQQAHILAQKPTQAITDPVFANPPLMSEDEPTAGTLDAVQKSYILEVLTKCQGKIAGRNGAAAMLNQGDSTSPAGTPLARVHPQGFFVISAHLHLATRSHWCVMRK
jgi:hypothetical protein